MKAEQLIDGWITLDAGRWVAGPGVTAAGGRLTIPESYTTSPDTTLGHYSTAVESVASWDLTGSHIVVELVTPPDGPTVIAATEARLLLHLGNADGPWLAFEYDGGSLHAGYRLAAGVAAQWVTEWGDWSTQARFWRIAERDGVIEWATSADLYEWATVGYVPTLGPFIGALGALKIRLEAGWWTPAPGLLLATPTPPAVFGPVNPTAGLPDDPGTLIAVAGAPNLAVDLLPDVLPGTFVVADHQVGSDELLGWGSGAEQWVNVVCDVQRVAVRRGATRLQGVLTRTEAGEGVVELEDVARRFDPIINGDAVHPGISVRVRAWQPATPDAPAWSEVLMQGRVGDDLLVQYRRTGSPLVSFTALDIVSPLARYAGPGITPGLGSGDRLPDRVARLVTETGRVPAEVIDLDVDPAGSYAATHPEVDLARAWQAINDATDAELGRVWVSKFDRLVVRSRGSQLSGPVRGMLSDWHGETSEGVPHCCYTDATVRFGTELLVNRAIAARRIPRVAEGAPAPAASAVAQVDDTVSQARYDVIAAVENRSLELAGDEQLAPWARYLVAQGATPEIRVDSVTLAPWGGDAGAWQAVCATDIGDRWAFRLHPQVGDTVKRGLGVLGIVHDITPDGWTTTLTTVDAPEPTEGNVTGWLIVGDGEVGSGDLLFPRGTITEYVGFGGP